MSEPKWMSAKWRIGEYQKVVDETNAIVRVSGVSLPCGNVPSDDESYEHGRLLSAAPDLYRALVELDKWFGPGSAKLHGAKSETLGDAREQASAALAKARGEV